MQMLFQWEMSQKDPQKLKDQFWKGASAADYTEEYANGLFDGAVREVEELDRVIGKHCHETWKFDRLAAIDRAILRLSVHELRRGGTPAKAVFNEATELAKKYSSESSAAFVNGVLNSVHKSLKKN